MSRMKDIATEALLEERGKDWGAPVITHAQIAKVWSGLLHRKLIADLEPHEVASMMSGLKLVRHGINPDNPDSLDDSDAYNEINRLCVQARQRLGSPRFVAELRSDEDEEIGAVATVEETWVEVPLPGFGTGPAAPAADTDELLLQGIENERLYEDEALRLAAEAKLSDIDRCINCGQRVFYLEGDYGVMAGHIYSRLGRKEMNISSLCEYCFDRITQEVELGEADPEPEEEGPNE